MKDRALIIDPSQILPEPLSAYLTGRGFEVDKTAIEAEAIRKMSEHHYALIFVSVIDSEGISQLREIRNRVRAPFHIIVSGPDVVSSAVTAFQNGANHYWANPVSMIDVQKLFDESNILVPPGKRYQREEALLQIIKEIALTMELDGLVNILMDSAMELTRADGGALLLLDEKSRSLIRKSVRGVSGGEQEDELFGVPESQYQKILLDRKPVLLNDPNLGNRKVRALIAAPIWSRDEPLGLLVNVKFASNKHSFSNDDYKVLSLLIDEISGAVFNAVTHYKTKELTIKDDLTEAYNRRYFERYLEEEFMRARRYGSNLSLIFFDVDNLKEVNMQHGHLCGSKTLQEVARRMILTVRGIDKVVRYGGDEFCVVLPETDSQGAFQVAERIRNVIASKPIVISENIQVAITGSIGIASYPIHAHSKDELVRQADKAMFVIKGKSKNAIAIAEIPAREQAGKAEGDS